MAPLPHLSGPLKPISQKLYSKNLQYSMEYFRIPLAPLYSINWDHSLIVNTLSHSQFSLKKKKKRWETQNSAKAEPNEGEEL